MSKRCLQSRYAESAAQNIYDLRDCVRTSETELYAKLDETATWLSELGARFAPDGALKPAHPAPTVEPPEPREAQQEHVCSSSCIQEMEKLVDEAQERDALKAKLDRTDRYLAGLPNTEADGRIVCNFVLGSGILYGPEAVQAAERYLAAIPKAAPAPSDIAEPPGEQAAAPSLRPPFDKWVLDVTHHELHELPKRLHGYLHTAFAQGVSVADAREFHAAQKLRDREAAAPSLQAEPEKGTTLDYDGRPALEGRVRPHGNGHTLVDGLRQVAAEATPEQHRRVEDNPSGFIRPEAAAHEQPDRLCKIPSACGWQCDMPYGHDGDMHGNAGDGFYSRQHLGEHRRQQAERASATPPQQ